MLESKLKRAFQNIVLATGLTLTPALITSCGSPPTYEDKMKMDVDQDGMNGYQEEEMHTDPENPDTDGEGLLDGEEVMKYHTNPLQKDTDNDKWDDYKETKMFMTDPLNSASHPQEAYDAGMDAGVTDTGTTASDAGSLDALVEDAQADAGINDATQEDAGVMDAYVEDATTGNQPPVANAGPDLTITQDIPYCVNFNDVTDVYNGACGPINGTGSHDSDGTIVNYKIWKDYANNPGMWSQNSTGHFVLGYSALGPKTVRLEVTDNEGATSIDETIVDVQP